MNAIEAIGKEVVDAAVAVHRATGPGLLERAYARALELELVRRGLRVQREVPIPLVWAGQVIDASAYRLDLLVGARVVVECKATARPHEVHRRQVLTYLAMGGYPLGYLLNFGGAYMKDGIDRVICDPRATRRWLHDQART